MAESAVNFLLQKLIAFAIEEQSLLGGFRREIEDISFQLESIRGFLRDADGRTESDSLKIWVGQVREATFNIEDILDEFVCSINRPQSGGFTGFILRPIRILYYKHRFVYRLHEMKEYIYSISKSGQRYNLRPIHEETSLSSASREHETAIFVQKDNIVGMKKEFELIVGWLLQEDKSLRVISVVGMGGVGKTSLVSKVIRCDQVRKQFHCFAVVSMSQNLLSRAELLRSIVKQLWQSNLEIAPAHLATMGVGDLSQLIESHLQPRRYLIVLDDVCSIKDWEDMRSVFPECEQGSRLMVTTRYEEVADFVARKGHVCRLSPLPLDAAWELFISKAFINESCPPELKQLAQRVVEKCEGLPLAIISIGGLLSIKEKSISEWTNVYNSLNFQLSSNPMFESLHNILFLSFYQLPYYLKHCFLYCSMFPEEHLIKRKQLIRLWVAEGFVEERNRMTMEEVAGEYLQELIYRNLLQVAEVNQSGRVKACRVHNMMREVAISFSREQQFFLQADADNAWQLPKFRRISISDDGGEILQSVGQTCSRLRSILIFRNVNTEFISSLAWSFPLLRVLDLGGAEVESMPHELSRLLNLRYLNLAGTRVNRLPHSVGRLQNLETLDVRFTAVERLPIGIGKLQKLRHLLCFPKFGSRKSIKIPGLLCRITSLQTLSVIEAGEEITRLIGNLTQLRSLSIAKVRAADGYELCTSVRRMQHLVQLGIEAFSEEEPLDLEFFSPPPLLQKLQLKGKLKRVPQWLCSLSSLTKLQLHWSRLGEGEGYELLSILQTLPSLVTLQLETAYDGEKLLFQHGGFPKLKVLTFIDLKWLRRVEIEMGAMPSLQKLNLRQCRELMSFPLGIEHLSNLQVISLCEMPKELDENEEREKFASIPIIRTEVMAEDRQRVEI